MVKRTTMMLICGLVILAKIACGGTDLDRRVRSDVDGRYGTISSPGFPASYRANENIRYVFDGKETERVQLEFVIFDLFYSEGDAANPNGCEGVDVVRVSNPKDNDNEIGLFCGSKMPPRLMSSSNQMELSFTSLYMSDSSTTRFHGFSARYRFISDFGIKSGQQVTDAGCVFEFHGEDAVNGTFTSPNHPGLYPRDTECHYLFYGKGKERIHIHFDHFHVEGIRPTCSEDTQSDFVEFSNFINVADLRIYRMCGDNVPVHDITSDGNFFRITFKSNDVYDSTGFTASYVITEEEDPFASDDGKKPAEGTSEETELPQGDESRPSTADEACVLLAFRSCMARHP